MIRGEKVSEITSSQKKKMTDEMLADIEDIRKEELSDDYVNDIKDVIDRFVKDYNLSMSEYEESENADLLAIGSALRYVTVAVAVLMAVILAALIIAYKSSGSGVYRAFRAYAVPTGTVTGLVLALCAAVEKILSGAITEAQLAEPVTSWVRSLLFNSALVTGAVFVFCVAAAIASYVYYANRTE